MIDVLVFIFLITLFEEYGIFLFIVFELVKYSWPQIRDRLERKKYPEAIDVDKIKAKSKSSASASPSFNVPRMELPKFKISFGLIVVIVFLLVILDGFTSIPAGHVGVVYDRGRGVLSEQLPEGLHIKIPLWQVITKMDARTTEYTMSATQGEGEFANGDDSMTAPTADGQTVTVDATVLFHIDKNLAATLYDTVGVDYIQKIVRPVARGQIRMVISRYTAIDIYSEKRAEAEQAMDTDIKKILAEKGIVLERILLRNITFGTEYARAIEDKQIAQQRIQKAEYERQEAEKVKERKIIEAEADAQAIKLKGEMLKTNPQVIQYEFVQKMAGNISWGVLPDNILPLMDLKKLSGGKE